LEFTSHPRESLLPRPETLAQLKRHSAQLDKVTAKLRERDRTLFDLCAKAIERSDMLRANIYANEMNRVRQLKRVITQTQLAIDCIAIRLESFMELYNLVTDLKPVAKVIQDISSDVKNVMPQFAAELEQLYSVANETLMGSSVDFSQPSLEQAFSANSKESKDILREVSELVEGNIKSSFPEPPIKAPQRILERPLEAFAYEHAPRQVEVHGPSSKGAASGDWSVLSDDVVKMLDDLNASGRVKMEECVA